MHISTDNILDIVTLEERYLPSNMNSWSTLEYLHFAVVHSKGQGQGHAYVDSDYLENGHIYENITPFDSRCLEKL